MKIAKLFSSPIPAKADIQTPISFWIPDQVRNGCLPFTIEGIDGKRRELLLDQEEGSFMLTKWGYFDG